jgi:hypothetical protein
MLPFAGWPFASDIGEAVTLVYPTKIWRDHRNGDDSHPLALAKGRRRGTFEYFRRCSFEGIFRSVLLVSIKKMLHDAK